MANLSTKFRAGLLGLAVIAGAAGCGQKPSPTPTTPAPRAQTVEQPAPVVAPPVVIKPAAKDPAITPNDPALASYWLTYSEVGSRADIDYNRRQQATDGKPIYAVTVSLPQEISKLPYSDSFDFMQRRNKLLLDFMSTCIGTQNTVDVTALSEGRIFVQTTAAKLPATIEITHIGPGQKDFTRDASFNCLGKETPAKINAGIATLKSGVAQTR